MPVHDQRGTTRTVPGQGTTGEAPPADVPSREPRHHPLSEFWDVRTASWRSRGPIPAPRRGD